MIRVILADDHKLIRDGVKALLNDEELVIAGEAATGNELVELLSYTEADVILLDISMPEMDGFECLRHLKLHYPEVKVLVLSMLENERYVHQMMEMGALGYISKNTGKEELRMAIKLVAKGTPYISSLLTMDLLRKANNPGFVPLYNEGRVFQERSQKELSKRELEVLHLISEGYTNADIAEQLFTSKRTIETHRQNLLEKTKTRNTAALVKYAMQNGIIS